MKTTLVNRLAALCLTALTFPAYATALHDGDSVQLNLAADEVNTEFYIDVPEGATHLTLDLIADRPKVEDVDVFLRYGEPFNAGSNIYPQSLYRSVGNTGEEFLQITYASSPPVSPGRWYLAICNACSTNDGPEPAAKATLTVDLKSEAEPTLKPLDIKVAYTDRANFGFNDNSPFQAQGGNNASTLGEARRNAFERAIKILEQSYSSPVPVFVEAHFEKIPEDENGGTALASAGPTFIASDFPGARLTNTWYPSSTVPRLAGTDYCRVFKSDSGRSCTKPVADIEIEFNSEPEWWYGFTPGPASEGFYFIETALHELIHGLGFLSLVDVKTGQKCCVLSDGTALRKDDIFSEQLVYINNGEIKPFNDLSIAQRRTAMTSLSKLQWAGDFGLQFDEQFTFGNHRTMYTPFTPNPGSSVSHTAFQDIMHFESAPGGDSGSAPQPGQALGAAWYFLRDAGWDESPKPKLGGDGLDISRGLYYDPSRNGHGFDFQRAGNLYFLLFYTYDENGAPEWYIAIMEETAPKVFTGDLSLTTYDGSSAIGPNKPYDSDVVGSVTVDFTATASSPVCADGIDRADSGLAKFSWTINDDSGDWCVQPVVPAPSPELDFTGSWFGGINDDGWGMTIDHTAGSAGKEVVVNTLYYYDSEGDPVWAQGITTDFANGEDIVMNEVTGYPRSADCSAVCSFDPDTDVVPAGTLSLTLVEPSREVDTGNRVTLDVTYQGAEGGSWERDAPIVLLSDPAE